MVDKIELHCDSSLNNFDLIQVKRKGYKKAWICAIILWWNSMKLPNFPSGSECKGNDCKETL